MKDLETFLRAGYSCLHITTHEEARVTDQIKMTAIDMGYVPWTWTCIEGVTGPPPSKGKPRTAIEKTMDPIAMLSKYCETEPGEDGPIGKHIQNKSVVILKDFHLFLTRNPMLIRWMKQAIEIGRGTNRHLIVIGCQMQIPPELEKDITVIEFKLPTKAELLPVAKQLAKSAKIELNGETEPILDAGSGLTTNEFADAVSWSIIKNDKKGIEAHDISNIKSEAIKKGGILEVINPGITFDDIGGLDDLRAWMKKRQNAFTEAARKYGLPMPKGVCLFGVQGCGKSFATRAIASLLGGPLLRLDAGKLFGGIVGSSEANVRAVIAQVEAFGKCTLQIEEIDKGFAGMTGGHDGDNGTTRRVIGTFLTWMAEKTSPVFIVATANDLTKLPPELLRKGRWDELFFIDLPTFKERVEIWSVQIRRHSRKPEDFDVNELARVTDNWTGAEIEALFNEALYGAFEMTTEPWTSQIVELSKNTMPLSKTMGESIEALRQWSRGRARSASTPEVTTLQPMNRKLA